MTRPLPAPDDRALPEDPDLVSRTAPTGRIVAAVSAGGAIGALARYQVGRGWPVPAAGFPWSTLVVNVSGCLLIGVLLSVLSARPGAHPLFRPFLGTGVLGGYTTFSTYTVDLHRLLTTGHPATAASYLAGTLVAALAATALGMQLGGRVARR